jgi:hypothetical protein
MAACWLSARTCSFSGSSLQPTLWVNRQEPAFWKVCTRFLRMDQANRKEPPRRAPRLRPPTSWGTGTDGPRWVQSVNLLPWAGAT